MLIQGKLNEAVTYFESFEDKSVKVKNLSKGIFNEEYVSAWSRWRGKGKQVREYAYKLLEEHTEFINSQVKK